MARLLIDRGADPNAAGAGYTALHAAVLRGDADTVKALLAKGANPNAQIDAGQSGAPLRIAVGAAHDAGRRDAAVRGHRCISRSDLMRVLLAGGASPSLALPNGTRPLFVAAGAEVRARGAAVGCGAAWHPRLRHAGDSAARKPICVAATRLLLDHGAGVTETNAAGDTALHAAAAAAAADERHSAARRTRRRRSTRRTRRARRRWR